MWETRKAYKGRIEIIMEGVAGLIWLSIEPRVMFL
jgi:hypothetical protein